MAVVGTADPIWSGWAASRKWGEDTSFTVIYRVTVDSLQDGPVIVDEATGLPRLGDSYSVGNDSDASKYCISKSFSRQDTRTWHVTCTFGPLSITWGGGTFAGRDKNGLPTTDPLGELMPFRTGQYTRSIPVEKAKNIKKIGSRDPGTVGPPTNAAGEVFDPPAEEDYSVMLLYITARTRSVPDGIIPDYFNAINADEFELSRAGFSMSFLPYTVKCKDIAASYELRNNKTYWEFAITFAVDSIFGWRLQIVNRGFQARAIVGDPDGKGGYIEDGDIDENAPKTRTLTDINGHALQMPVLLDIAGQPLDPDKPAVYLEYSSERTPELDFRYLSLVLGFDQ